MLDVCSSQEISLGHWSSRPGTASLPCAPTSAHRHQRGSGTGCKECSSPLAGALFSTVERITVIF